MRNGKTRKNAYFCYEEKEKEKELNKFCSLIY